MSLKVVNNLKSIEEIYLFFLQKNLCCHVIIDTSILVYLYWCRGEFVCLLWFFCDCYMYLDTFLLSNFYLVKHMIEIRWFFHDISVKTIRVFNSWTFCSKTALLNNCFYLYVLTSYKLVINCIIYWVRFNLHLLEFERIFCYFKITSWVHTKTF